MTETESKTIVLSEDDITKVKKLASYHLTAEQIADVLGVARSTFFNIMNRQPEVQDAFHRGQTNLAMLAKKRLAEKISDGDLTAIIFYLKTKQGWSTQ